MNRRFLLVAVLLAGLSAALVYARISSTDDSGGRSAGSGEQAVVVAKTAIKQRTAITPEMLEVKPVATEDAITGAFTSIDQVVGKVTKFPIEANQQVAAIAVVDTAQPASVQALSYVVPTGKRAMSITASQVISAGGLILPGDYVDVIWGCCSDRPVVVNTILRNVQVAAVAQNIVNSGPVAEDDPSGVPVAAEASPPVPDAVTITLLLTPEEAQRVFLAESIGKIRVDLRGIGDETTPDSGFALLTDLLPLDIVNALPEELRPEGYRDAVPAPAGG
jgi:pilus assembly protein CpaB